MYLVTGQTYKKMSQAINEVYKLRGKGVACSVDSDNGYWYALIKEYKSEKGAKDYLEKLLKEISGVKLYVWKKESL